MALPALVEDLLAAFPKSKAQKQRGKEIENFRNHFTAVVGQMILESKNESTREVLGLVRHRASNAVIDVNEGGILSKLGNTVTLGENVKQYAQNPKTGEVMVQGPDRIELPKELLFDSENKIRPDGKGRMAFVHELCHGGIKDEFWADVVAIRAGIRMGFPEEEIMGHIVGRRAAIGIGGEAALFKFAQRKFLIINERAKKIYLRRIEKLGRKAREKEERRFAKHNEKRFTPAARQKIQGMRINPARLFRPRPIRAVRRAMPRPVLPMRRNRPRRPF